MTEPAPAVESLSAEEATAAIATYRAGPIAALPSNEYMTALYQRAYSAPAAPALAPETVAAAKETIAVLRKELDAERDNTPRARELNAQLQEQYKALHGEPSSNADGTPTDADHEAAGQAAGQHTPPPGERWDRASLAYGHAAMRARLDAADAAELFGFVLPMLTHADQQIRNGLKVSSADTERLLRAEWGSDYDRRMGYVDDAWNEVDETQQHEWTRRGVRFHPDMVRFMSTLGERASSRGKAA